MKKYRTTLVIAAAAVLLVGALYVILLNVKPEEEPIPSPSPAEEKKSLVNLERSAVDRVVVTQPDGTQFSVYNDADKARVAPVRQGFSYALSEVGTLYAAVLKLDADRLVSEKPSAVELMEMGFDSGSLVCRLYEKSGGTTTLTLGKLNVTGSGYYVRLNDEEAVYLISKYRGDTMSRPEHVYRDYLFLPAYDAEQDYATLFTSLSWSYQDRPVEIEKRPAEEVDPLVDFNQYRILQPFEAECDDEFLIEKIVNTIKTIRPSQLVEDDPQDLAVYGLEDPLHLTLTDENGWSGTLLIGGRDEASGGRYVMHPGVPSVLLDTLCDYSFLDIAPHRMRGPNLFIHSIKNVTKVEAVFTDKTRVLEIDDRAETDDQEASFSALLDGEEVEETNARRLFLRMIGVKIEAEIPENAVLGERKLRVVFHMRDGDMHTLELFAINERHMAVVVDGESTGFYANVRILNIIAEGFAIQDAGGDIPFAST